MIPPAFWHYVAANPFSVCPFEDRAMQKLRKKLYLQALESRIAPALFTVQNLNDSGADSLRDCIGKANAAGGEDTIGFSGALSGDTITLTTGEISITGALW